MREAKQPRLALRRSLALRTEVVAPPGTLASARDCVSRRSVARPRTACSEELPLALSRVRPASASLPNFTGIEVDFSIVPAPREQQAARVRVAVAPALPMESTANVAEFFADIIRGQVRSGWDDSDA